MRSTHASVFSVFISTQAGKGGGAQTNSGQQAIFGINVWLQGVSKVSDFEGTQKIIPQVLRNWLSSHINFGHI